MTLQDLRAIAHYHEQEAIKCSDAILGIEAIGIANKHAVMLMHWRNQLRFHQQTGAQLKQLAAAFLTIGGLTAE